MIIHAGICECQIETSKHHIIEYIAIAIVYGYSYTHNDIDKWCVSVFVSLYKDNCGLPSHISMVTGIFTDLKSLLSATNDTQSDHLL